MKTMKVIAVDCEYNDPVDVRAGGPEVLGFDFYISDTADTDKYIEFIKETLKKYNRPLMNIRVKDSFINTSQWTIESIEKCISKGY